MQTSFLNFPANFHSQQLSHFLSITPQYTQLTLSDYPTKMHSHLLSSFFQIQELIQSIGDEEHTGDWDPSFIIKLTDGTQIETCSGYANGSIKDNLITILDADWDTDKEFTRTIKLSDITYIETNY